MKNSTKFWYSVLVLVIIILIFSYFTIFTKVVFFILILTLSVALLLYLFFGIGCIIISMFNGFILDGGYTPKDNAVYLIGAKYNIFYFIFYTCIVKFNNWLNNLNK